jgi:hypothetical protein
MKIVYTKHTLKRMRQRKIRSEWVRRCLEIPDYIVSDKEINKNHLKIDSKILRVVWEIRDNFINVISVMWR